MLKVALYLHSKGLVTIAQLKGYYYVYGLLDLENMGDGAAQDIESLFNSFILLNRFLPKKLIALWLSHHKSLLKDQATLQPNEYFLLAANTYDRTELFAEKFPFAHLTLNKEESTGCYSFEAIRPPGDCDIRLNNALTDNIQRTTVRFDWNPQSIHNSDGLDTKIPVIEANPPLSEFKTLLRDPFLYKQIKAHYVPRPRLSQGPRKTPIFRTLRLGRDMGCSAHSISGPQVVLHSPGAFSSQSHVQFQWKWGYKYPRLVLRLRVSRNTGTRDRPQLLRSIRRELLLLRLEVTGFH